MAAIVTSAERARRCAIYTRKSTDERLDRDYNTLESQRDVCSAYIRSQRHKGWLELGELYDDPAQSGGTLVRPALQRLMADIERGAVDVVVIYKIDRLTRSLGDFVRLMDLFERYEVSFVSITQSFDTSDSMGRLVLNILLTFAQFEREMAADRIRDKVAAMKRRGKWTGGPPPFGYDVVDGRLIPNAAEAETVNRVYRRFLELGSYVALRRELQEEGLRTKTWTNRKGVVTGGGVVSSGMVYNMLASRFYVGEVPHHGESFPGEHEAIVDRALWEEVQALRARRAMFKLDLGPSPNVLLGILHDGHGRRMTIADDSTRGRRYRYYISDQARWAARQGVKRLRAEAGELERLVLAALCTTLRDQSETRAALASLGSYEPATERLVAAGPAAAGRLARAPAERLRLMLTAVLARVEVTRSDVTLLVRCAELERLLAWNGTGVFRRDPTGSRRDDRVHVVRIPAVAVRIERTLALPLDRRDPASAADPSPSLVALIREARRAQAALDDDRTAPVAEVAARFRRQPGIFARLVRLNYLAPDIIAAILDGRQPPRLTRRVLLYASLPMDWAQQRTLLGFAPAAEVQLDEQRY
ncbi:recombinase family protein [Sphingomonas corticis]|uniref:Recombinase family protein n=1 Tax=Sphingomonas corticis TaxID=2722791 RepID=A0ABX1CWF5_9SPHN|nr:recombinase family protein [Sphingomonas corticis]NJR80267.1 recombinase family protein [Sphingomonas corticis]